MQTPRRGLPPTGLTVVVMVVVVMVAIRRGREGRWRKGWHFWGVLQRSAMKRCSLVTHELWHDFTAPLQTESTELQSGNALKISTLLPSPQLPIAHGRKRPAGLLVIHRNLKYRRTGMSLLDDYFTTPTPPDALGQDPSGRSPGFM